MIKSSTINICKDVKEYIEVIKFYYNFLSLC